MQTQICNDVASFMSTLDKAMPQIEATHREVMNRNDRLEMLEWWHQLTEAGLTLRASWLDMPLRPTDHDAQVVAEAIKTIAGMMKDCRN